MVAIRACPRGDLAASIFRTTDGGVETIFGDSVAAIEQNDTSLRVTFESGRVREFDLVVGADGLHSQVRKIMFGPESLFEKYLGYKVAAFETSGYRPRDELTYVMYTQVGCQVARFAMRGDRTMFLLTFADEDLDNPIEINAQRALIRQRFERSEWECPRILDLMDAADNVYFDRVSQIRMDTARGSWTKGRVTLIGDAAACVSLLAGEGCGLAMTAAYILAGELHKGGKDLATALVKFQYTIGPLVRRKQKTALRFASTFAPKSKMSLFLRNQIMNLLTVPPVAHLALGRDLTDNITLPEY